MHVSIPTVFCDRIGLATDSGSAARPPLCLIVREGRGAPLVVFKTKTCGWWWWWWWWDKRRTLYAQHLCGLQSSTANQSKVLSIEFRHQVGKTPTIFDKTLVVRRCTRQSLSSGLFPAQTEASSAQIALRTAVAIHLAVCIDCALPLWLLLQLR